MLESPRLHCVSAVPILLFFLAACGDDGEGAPKHRDSLPGGNDTGEEVANQPPSAPVVALTPDPAVTTDDLTASIESPSVDPEGGEVSYSWAWYQDGTLSSASISDTLPASTTAKDQTWTVLVTPNDGLQEGPSGEDSSTIADCAPEVAVDIMPLGPVQDCDELFCEVDVTDADGDLVDVTVSWTVDGSAYEAAGTTSWPGDTVSVDVPLAGEVWTCTATPDDGTHEGLAVSASATILSTPCPVYVDPGIESGGRGCHGDPLSSIADALVQAAADGCTTIMLEPGTYDEQVDFAGQAVTITSSTGPATTIIAPSAGGTVVTFASGEDSASVLEGVTITGGTEHGVLVASASPTITGCVITGNSGELGSGILATDYDGLFQGNEVSHNVASSGGGLYLDGGSAVIDGNRFEANEAEEGAGIWLEATALLSNNLVLSSVGDGILLYGTDADDYDASALVNNTVALSSDAGLHLSTYNDGTGYYGWHYVESSAWNNIFYGSGSYDVYFPGSEDGPFGSVSWWNNSVHVGYSSHAPGTSRGCFQQDPLFADPEAGDFSLDWGSPCIDVGRDPSEWGVSVDFDGAARTQGPATDMGAREYPGPTDDCDGVGDGSHCATGCPVYVDPGVLPGGDGDAAAPYACIPYALAYRGSCDEVALLPGTYQAEIDYAGEDLYIHSTDGAEATLLFSAVGREVVSMTSGETSAAILEGVTVSGSIEHGILIDGGSSTILDCIITENRVSEEGGGVSATDWDGLFQGNVVSQNYSGDGGGGLYIKGGSAVIDGNWFEANQAGTGAGLWLQASATVSNNVFLDSVGQGVHLNVAHNTSADASWLVGNTIVGASTYGIHIGQYQFISTWHHPTTSVLNNIVYGSGDYDVYVAFYDEDRDIFASLTWQDNDVFGGSGWHTAVDPTGTDGNLAVDPQFVDEGAYDFSLASASTACIDQGQDLSAYGVTTDIEGVVRPQGAAYDIGAYESY